MRRSRRSSRSCRCHGTTTQKLTEVIGHWVPISVERTSLTLYLKPVLIGHPYHRSVVTSPSSTYPRHAAINPLGPVNSRVVTHHSQMFLGTQSYAFCGGCGAFVGAGERVRDGHDGGTYPVSRSLRHYATQIRLKASLILFYRGVIHDFILFDSRQGRTNSRTTARLNNQVCHEGQY